MGTTISVTSYTKSYMDSHLIKSAAVVSGNLILTYTDNSTSNAGSVIGPTGPSGIGTICTSGTRPSSPTKGYLIYETDTGKLLVYYGATTQWMEPWDLPWGYIARSSTTADTALSTVSGSTWQDVSVLNLSGVNLVANRMYEVTVSIPLFSYLYSTITKFRITNGSGTLLRILPKIAVPVSGLTTYSPTATFTASAESNATIKLQYLHDASPAGLSLAANGSYGEMVIKDIGPSSTPPSA